MISGCTPAAWRLSSAVVAVAVLVIVVVLGSSCASAGSTSYADQSALARFRATGVEVHDVSVTLDYVCLSDISSQMAAFARASLEGLDRPADSGAERVARVSIEVNQRSFLSGIDSVNSIFVSMTVTDDVGAVLCRETLYRVGNDSILSASVQIGLMRDITRALKDRLKRKREIDAR